MFSIRPLFAALASILSSAVMAFASPATAQTVSIHFDAAASGNPVNPGIFGHFIKGADNYGIFSIPYPDIASIAEGDGIWNPEAQAPYADAIAILKSYHPGILRYPDGLGIHGHDWKKTIGPVSERGDRKFGLNEFMQVARAVDAEPIIVVSEYIGTPQDAADLVEYLNAPATPKHPWAMRRAKDGHPAPYGVRLFEMGNESWVDWRKIGKPQVRPAAEVGRYASELARAMKAVDSKIRCGVPYGEGRWNEAVFRAITSDIDFAIVHTYPVKYGGGDLMGDKEDQILEAMMAAGHTTALDLQTTYKEIARLAGRPLPLAVTEYNMGPTQQQPNLKRPYRYSLAAALGTGDYIGRLLAPDSRVESAIYWSWLNGFFESVHTYAGHPWKTRAKLETPLLRPVHNVFELWGDHRGTTLLPIHVNAPRLEFSGLNRMRPSRGEQAQDAAKLSNLNLIDDASLRPVNQPGIKASHAANQLGQREWVIRYDNVSKNAYPPILIRDLRSLDSTLRPPAPDLVYKISFDAQWTPEPDSATPNLGLGIMDSRGWNASGSAIAIHGLQGANDWTHFEDHYQPLAETQAIVILSRIEGGTTPTTGTLRIRNLSIEAWRAATYPARPALSAYITRSADGNDLNLIVFNLTLNQDLISSISWQNFNAGAVTYSELNADSAAAINSTDSPAGWVHRNQSVTLNTSQSITHTFPAHSATVFLLKRKTN